MTNLEKFLGIYAKYLRARHTNHPQNYAWNISSFEWIFKEMSAAIVTGNFLKDSPTFKLTCKELGIKHTYKAIKEFIA